MENATKNNQSLGMKIFGFACFIAAFVIGKYSGISFLIPAAACGLAWWASSKILTSAERVLMIPAFSIQFGHLLWLSAGLFVAGGGAAILDIIFISIGLAWLIGKPGLPPIIFLGVIQLLSLIVNGVAFHEAELSSLQHKALLIHLILRISAVSMMVIGYLRLKSLRLSASVDS